MMVEQTVEVVAGTIIDDDHVVTMVEICRSCGVRADAVTEMIELGILEPVAGDSARRGFSGSSSVLTKTWQACLREPKTRL